MARLDRASRAPKPPESKGGEASLDAFTGQVGEKNLSQGSNKVG